MITADSVNFKFISHSAYKNHYHGCYRDNELGLQYEYITNRTQGGMGTGKQNNFYFIDNDKREFGTIDDLIDAYNEKFKYEEENPTKEVIWYKVVRDRKIKLTTEKPNDHEE